MRFTFTHPMHTHPYNPELVTGDGIATVAAAAEAAGFHGFGFTDHPAPTQRWLEAGGHDALDPFVAMGYAAARTTTLRLIPNIVVLPYRNPFLVAKSGATLDVLSGGRFTLGVGVKGISSGNSPRSAWTSTSGRGCSRRPWRSSGGSGPPTTSSYDGRHFTAKGITAHPRPVSTASSSDMDRRQYRCRAQARRELWRRLVPVPGARDAGPDRTYRDDGLTRRVGCGHRRFTSTIRRGRPRFLEASTSRLPTPTAADPGSDDFNADAYLADLDKLATIGVTWVQVWLPGGQPDPRPRDDRALRQVSDQRGGLSECQPEVCISGVC